MIMPSHRQPLNTCCAPVEVSPLISICWHIPDIKKTDHNPPPKHVSSEIRSYITRYNRTPTTGPIFTPVQKDWLKDHIPQYMQWPPTSDETIAFVKTMIIDFDHMWPLHQKLWPGSNVHILLTDSMRAKLTAEMLILRGVSQLCT